MSLDRDPANGEITEDVENFISSKFSKTEQTNLKEIEDTAIDSGPMSKNCRLVFNIASLHCEKGVSTTLLSFLDQRCKEKILNFEIIILINGPEGVDIKTQLHNDAIAVKNDIVN